MSGISGEARRDRREDRRERAEDDRPRGKGKKDWAHAEKKGRGHRDRD